MSRVSSLCREPLVCPSSVSVGVSRPCSLQPTDRLQKNELLAPCSTQTACRTSPGGDTKCPLDRSLTHPSLEFPNGDKRTTRVTKRGVQRRQLPGSRELEASVLEGWAQRPAPQSPIARPADVTLMLETCPACKWAASTSATEASSCRVQLGHDGPASHPAAHCPPAPPPTNPEDLIIDRVTRKARPRRIL